jgi:phospholipase/carboxylesterase
MTPDPHKNDLVRRLGPPIEDATGVVILLHGRGGSAEDILSLAGLIKLPQLTYLAPQAAENSWYPNSFLAPIASNEPWLSSALRKVESIVEMVEHSGISASRIAIGGFSQGACLATEFVARHPRRYAALFALTGGLIGPPDADLSHAGNLDGTPAFFASSDPDPHVPWARVKDSAAIFKAMGASVSLKRYEGRGHTISAEELDLVSELLRPAFGK